MSEQLPAPDFDAQNYARPNQNWICGHACEGNACRQGPDAKGRCCATAECKPVLQTKPGEAKGRWVCTRPGGACDAGPLPNGSCCRPIAKCSPVPTLRVWRGRVTLAVIAASCAILLLLLGNPPWRNNFISPGEISRAHSGEAFAALFRTNHFKQNCEACHVAGNSGPNRIVQTAWRAEPGIFDLQKLASAHAAEPTRIDASCLLCHAGQNFHQPNAPAISCAFCHTEHQGQMMATTTDANCAFCHGNAATLAAARGGQAPLPVIHHFAEDHPQFRFSAEKLRDPDTLKFNHALHLTGTTIPKLPNGKKLDCAFCHQLDATGALMKPVAFEQNCRGCHSLQFDPETPQLILPHGSAAFVAAFLHSLPKQYTDLAMQENQSDPNGFAAKKVASLRAQFGSGEALEQRVFFSSATFGPATQIGTLSGQTRALFPGCALCHEVKAGAAGWPQITPPVQTERWLGAAKFMHAPHANIACAQCHDAVQSKATADVLLPAKEICATCHNPRAGVADTCATCHTYHRPQVAAP